MLRLSVIGVLICGLAGMALPHVLEAYQRHRVFSALDPVMNDQDRAAFQAWQGDAQSFVKSLYARCEISRGEKAAACEPYRLAL
jgi:hypothetical protein